jgi:hypothetical protein
MRSRLLDFYPRELHAGSGSEAQQRSAHGGLHVGVTAFASRVASLPRIADKYISPALARRGSPNSVMRQPGHQPAAGTFDAHQAHSLGGCQVGAAHQIAQHINGQRLTLRQRVDHPRAAVQAVLRGLPAGGSADPAGAPPCRTSSPRPRRRSPTSTLRPISASARPLSDRSPAAAGTMRFRQSAVGTEPRYEHRPDHPACSRAPRVSPQPKAVRDQGEPAAHPSTTPSPHRVPRCRSAW